MEYYLISLALVFFILHLVLLNANILRRRFSTYDEKHECWLVFNLVLKWVIYDCFSFFVVKGQVTFQSMHKLVYLFIYFQIWHFYLCLRQPSLHCFYPYRKEPQIILKA